MSETMPLFEPVVIRAAINRPYARNRKPRLRGRPDAQMTMIEMK